jgi:hypothetical protein
MRSFAIALVVLNAFACGSRTGLNALGEPSRPEGTSATPAPAPPLFCALLAGQVDSCVATSETGPVTTCGPSLPVCTKQGGSMFLCCTRDTDPVAECDVSSLFPGPPGPGDGDGGCPCAGCP